MPLIRDNFTQSNNKNRRSDSIYIIFGLILFLLIIFNFISNINITSASYGAIYTPIIIFFLIIAFVAILSKGKLTNLVIYGSINNRKQLYIEIALAGAVGLIWVLAVVYNPFAGLGFSIVSPLPFAISGTALAALPTIAIVGIIGPDIEENFIQASLIPTIATKLSDPGVLAFLGLLGGIYFTFINQIYILAIGFFALGFIFLFSKFARKILIKSSIGKHVLAIILGAVIFASFHIYAYGTAPNVLALMTSAGLFAVLMGIYNWQRQNTVGSRLIHSMNNTTLAVVAVGLSFGVIALVFIVYAFIIAAGYEAGNVGKTAQQTVI